MSSPSDGRSLASLLGSELLEATQICSLPHWLDDPLATELLELTGRNGSSPKLVQRVKRLPIVQPFEGTSWRVDEVVRDELIEGLRESKAFKVLSAFLAERFASEFDAGAEPVARESRVKLWRSAYHYADVNAEVAVDRLTDLVTRAASHSRLSDVEAAIELLERHESLSTYTVELAYARGRLAYARDNDEVARTQFQIVWNAGGVNLPTSVAGHLLGVIGIRQKEAPAAVQATLRAAANIALEINDQCGRQQILNTLANHLLDAPASASMAEIVNIAQQAADLAEACGDAILAATTYTTLGQVQIRNGDLVAARGSFQRAVHLSEQTGALKPLSVALLSWSWLARTQGDTVEAAELVERALTNDIERGASAYVNVRLTAQRLANLLASAADLPPEWNVIERSTQRLVYVRGAHLVIVAFTPTPDLLPIPHEARGWWRDRHSGTTFDLGTTADVGAILGRRPGAVLARPSQ